MSHTSRTITVTGATGFVGRALCARLLRDEWRVVALIRSCATELPDGVEARPVGDLSAVQDFTPHLTGSAAVIHLAAKVHVMRPTPEDEAAFQAVNVTATRRLAEGAATAGVGRLVFASSIKVNGDASTNGRPFRADDRPAPTDAYGRSKAEAEAELWDVAARTGLEVAIIRPPVVYGPGVKANVAALARLCNTPLPLPFGATRNARSLIAVDNLADALAVAASAPAAAGKTFLVRDGEDVSTGELVRRIRHLQGRPPRLLPVPQGMMTLALHLFGQDGLASRLFGSLTVDDTPIRRELNWKPPLTLEEGLARMLGRSQTAQSSSR